MNHQSETFDLGVVEATVVLDAGPRILGYARHGGPQLFASVPGEVLDRPGGPGFELIGGHRLWRAPEAPEVTYRPDSEAVTIDHDNHGIRITGPADAEGISKTITLRPHDTITVVDHTLRNEGWSPVRCAPWAITQLEPGGIAVLPQSLDPVDPDGVLPNRSIVLWPYTDPSAPELDVLTGEVVVHATDSPARTKVGQPNRRGWIAYVLADEVFVKWSPLHHDDAVYADLGASVECYRDHRFLELETLGPLVDVAPGTTVDHREAWTLIPLDGRPIGEVLASLPEQPAEMIE